MKVGLHQMNIHVIRWATQGFANVIAAEGEDAKKKGVAICMDCRNNNMLFPTPPRRSAPPTASTSAFSSPCVPRRS